MINSWTIHGGAWVHTETLNYCENTINAIQTSFFSGKGFAYFSKMMETYDNWDRIPYNPQLDNRWVDELS